jgi:hypothetical protein
VEPQKRKKGIVKDTVPGFLFWQAHNIKQERIKHNFRPAYGPLAENEEAVN